MKAAFPRCAYVAYPERGHHPALAYALALLLCPARESLVHAWQKRCRSSWCSRVKILPGQDVHLQRLQLSTVVCTSLVRLSIRAWKVRQPHAHTCASGSYGHRDPCISLQGSYAEADDCTAKPVRNVQAFNLGADSRLLLPTGAFPAADARSLQCQLWHVCAQRDHPHVLVQTLIC